MKKAFLILEDGSVFEGQQIGADTETIGELVFTTGMCGYIETLTDPSYYGQIILHTFPLMGNYGMTESGFEAPCCVKGYVIRELCDAPSNFQCRYDMDTYLKSKGIAAICGVDTREITKIIRERGVMNAKICSKIPDNIDDIKNYTISGAVDAVTSKCIKKHTCKDAEYNIAVINYGAEAGIVNQLLARKCNVTVFPAGALAEDILKTAPDGIVLSNGPGDPAENTAKISEIKKLMGKIPILGICLGHQLLALAAGAKTEKLKYGHRGGNQPVKDIKGTRTYITSQNHGYAVVSDSITNGEVRYINANDGTCEGIDYPEISAFSVQFSPETASGPKETAFVFDRFISMIGGDC